MISNGPVTVELEDDAQVLDVAGDAQRLDDGTIEVHVCPLAPGERRRAVIHHTGRTAVDASVHGEIANLPRGLEGPRDRAPRWSRLASVIIVGGFGTAVVVGVLTEDSYEGWNTGVRVLAAVAMGLACVVLSSLGWWVADRLLSVLGRRLPE